ncbi:MAG: hypothetical protein WA659_00565 [Candidatus Aquirickettsiella sp.]
MKLKQALIIGLSSAILAIPAFAAGSVPDQKDAKTNQPMTMEMPNKDAKTNQPMTMEMPANKEAVHHRKGHKKVSLERKLDEKQAKENAKLDELNTLNSVAAKDQTEKNSIKS